MKRTYQPSKRKHQKVHGFRARMATVGGRTFFLEEERKAERFYPHRNHLLGDFFVWIGK